MEYAFICNTSNPGILPGLYMMGWLNPMNNKIEPYKNIEAEVKNNAEQYLKARKSEPAVASILDGMDKNTIDEMEDKIIGEINKNSEGYSRNNGGNTDNYTQHCQKGSDLVRENTFYRHPESLPDPHLTHLPVFYNMSVKNADNPLGLHCYTVIVGYKYNCIALGMKFMEQFNNFLA